MDSEVSLLLLLGQKYSLVNVVILCITRSDKWVCSLVWTHKVKLMPMVLSESFSDAAEG